MKSREFVAEFEASQGFFQKTLSFQDSRCDYCFLLLFLLRGWVDIFFFFFLLGLITEGCSVGSCVGSVQPTDGASGTLPAGSPGEKGDASAVSSVALELRGPVVPEEYSCAAGVRKSCWCRGLRCSGPCFIKRESSPVCH